MGLGVGRVSPDPRRRESGPASEGGMPEGRPAGSEARAAPPKHPNHKGPPQGWPLLCCPNPAAGPLLCILVLGGSGLDPPSGGAVPLRPHKNNSVGRSRPWAQSPGCPGAGWVPAVICVHSPVWGHLDASTPHGRADLEPGRSHPSLGRDHGENAHLQTCCPGVPGTTPSPRQLLPLPPHSTHSPISLAKPSALPPPHQDSQGLLGPRLPDPARLSHFSHLLPGTGPRAPAAATCLPAPSLFHPGTPSPAAGLGVRSESSGLSSDHGHS